MQLPGVSVIIPTFNRATRVVHAVDSVLSQTYPAEACDIIVVDDGSSDGTQEILTARFGSRIRFLRQPNFGPSAARNTGIDAARHDLVSFLDSDDRWLPNKLMQQVPSLNIPDVVLSYSNWTQRGRPAPADRFSEIGLKLNAAVAVLDCPLRTLLRQEGSGIWTSTCVARKDALRRCGRFDERMKICEDIRLWLRLAMEGKFTVLSQPLAERGEAGRDNLTQLTDTSYARESARLRLEVFWETYAHAIDAPPDILARLRHFIVDSLSQQSVSYALTREYSRARRKAIEALAFAPTGVDLAKLLGCACIPSLVRPLQRWVLCRRPEQRENGHCP